MVTRVSQYASTFLLLPLVYPKLTRHPEVAKGHTNASATTRLTAAKDAASDKVDEKKHDVGYFLLLSPPPSPSPAPLPLCGYDTNGDLSTDQVRRLRQQIGIAFCEHNAYPFSHELKGHSLRQEMIVTADGY